MKSIFLMLGGFVFLCFGLWQGCSEQSFLSASTTTIGKMTSKPVEHSYYHHGYKVTRYSFSYAFSVNGQVYTGLEGNADDLSDNVTVYYERANPSNNRADVPDPWTGWKLAILGLVCVSLATRGVRKAYRDYRKFSEAVETPDD